MASGERRHPVSRPFFNRGRREYVRSQLAVVPPEQLKRGMTALLEKWKFRKK